MASGGGVPLYPEILHYDTIILQRIGISVEDAGFDPGTATPPQQSVLLCMLFKDTTFY